MLPGSQVQWNQWGQFHNADVLLNWLYCSEQWFPWQPSHLTPKLHLLNWLLCKRAQLRFTEQPQAMLPRFQHWYMSRTESQDSHSFNSPLLMQSPSCPVSQPKCQWSLALVGVPDGGVLRCPCWLSGPAHLLSCDCPKGFPQGILLHYIKCYWGIEW